MKILTKVPPWIVTSWLIKACGLTSREASLARLAAQERVNKKCYEENIEQSKVPTAPEAGGETPPATEAEAPGADDSPRDSEEPDERIAEANAAIDDAISLDDYPGLQRAAANTECPVCHCQRCQCDPDPFDYI